MTLKPYPVYKESGVEWLGMLPESWSAKPVKAVAESISGGTPDTENQDFWVDPGEGTAWVAIADMSSTDDVKATTKAVSPEGIAAVRLTIGEPGTVLFAMYASVGEVSQLGVKASWNQALLGFRANDDRLFSRFLFYSLKGAKPQLPFLYRSNTQNNLNAKQVAGIRLAMPPLAEQRQIAAYLDTQTAKIDTLIGKQEQLIETLAERRQAVISHAVTKGLHPNVPMKDSGNHWLGEVPASWVVLPIKRMTTLITDGAHISPETDDGVYDFVSTRDVSARGIDFDGALKTSPSSYGYLVRNGCQPVPGDVLFSKDGTVGRTVVVKIARPFVVASSLIIVRPDRSSADSHFLDYLFQSVPVQEQVRSLVKGAGLPRLSISNLLKVVGVFPALSEQLEVVGYLARETAQMDTLSVKAREMIDMLKERRQALIIAAVTGKIDARGLA